MKKRIVAAVLAILMVGSSLPMSEFARVLPDFGITASAEEEFKPFSSDSNNPVRYQGMVASYKGLKDKDGVPYLSVNVTGEFYTGTTEITINTRGLRGAIAADIVKVTEGKSSINDCKYVELTSSKDTKNPLAKHITGNENIAHVIFDEDDNFFSSLGGLFVGCKNLNTVKFNSHITKLSTSTFSGCINFVGSKSNNTVELDNISYIGDKVFQGCETLAGAKLGNNLNTIDDSAFAGCIKLTNITIPKNTSKIGKGVFAGDTALKTVKFQQGSALRILGDNAFNGCTALTKVYVGNAENTLPSNDRLFRVGKGCFAGCTSLQHFTIPKTMKYLNEGMFMKCTSLKTVTFEDDSECELIYQQAFQECSSINEMTLPDKVLGIGTRAFYKCSKLSKLIVPDTIYSFAVIQNPKWKGETEDANGKKETIPEDDLKWDDEGLVKQCDLPDPLDTSTWEGEAKYVLIDRYGVKEGGYAFAECPVLSIAPESKEDDLKPNQILMPGRVDYIPIGCFNKDTGITDVQMPKVYDIGDRAFEGCKSLPEVTVPDAADYIRVGVFKDCTSLLSVTYSKKTFKIDDQAFYNCSSLFKVTPSDKKAIKATVQFPQKCGFVGRQAFAKCVSLKYLNILGGTKSEFAIMEDEAFAGCSKLEGATVDGTTAQELRFPSKVTVIEKGVFKDCSKIKTAKFEGNVTSVGDEAFSGCKSLTKTTFNPTIKQIGQSAFKNCESLESLPVTADGTSALVQLEDIKDYTFQNCKSITEADLSAAKDIVSIGKQAFDSCIQLRKLYLPTDGELGIIGDSAFSGCEKLATVTTDKKSRINTLPASVHNVGSRVFTNTAIQNFTLVKPSNTKYYNVVGEGAFSDCLKLETVDLSGSNLTTVSKSLFSGDTALKQIKLPTTLTTIQDSAFSGCTALEMINSDKKGVSQLPSKLKTIGDSAFAENLNISKVIIPAKTDDIKLNAWDTRTNISDKDMQQGKYAPIKQFVVNKNNENYTAVDGVLYNKKGTQKLLIYPLMKSTKNFKVPDFVEQIAKGSIESNRYIESIEMSNSVKKIEENAISKCKNLRAIYFGSNNKVEFANNSVVSATTDPKLVFYGAKGSTAEKYASSNSKGITFIDNEKAANTITIDNSKATNTVTIKQGEEIRVNRNEAGRFKLDAIVLDKNAKPTEDELVWESSDLNVLTVDNDGNVTLKGDGKAVITVRTANGLKASMTVYVGVKVIDYDMIKLVETKFIYDGTEKKQKVIVKDGDYTLVEGKDYNLTYKNNINAGKAIVYVNGIGKYSGNRPLEFIISPKSIKGAAVTIDPKTTEYTGKPITPLVTVKVGGKLIFEERDYTLKYEKNVDVGTADITITGKANYEGVLIKHFTITQKPIDEVEYIELDEENFTYDGKAKKPKVTISGDGKTNLKQGVDYTVEIKDNVEAGEGTVIIRGIGKYCGMVTKPFYIMPKSLDDEQRIKASIIKEDFTYDGKAKKPKVKVTYTVNSKTKYSLVEGTDYTLSYENNVEVGENASVIITGKGNYADEITLTFEIRPKNIQNTKVILDQESFDYDGTIKEPGVKVYDGKVLLKENEDYEVSYENNIEPGTAYAVITGIGKYVNTKKVAYTIENTEAVVKRIAGANRYETAAKISEEMYQASDTDTAILVTGLDFHDALVAVPLARAYDAPLLLATEKHITGQTLAELERLKVKNVIIVSTNGAIGAKAKAELAGYDITAIEGKNCFETASKVAKALQTKTKKAPDTIFFATDSAYADALSASPVAAIKGAPIIYLNNKKIDSATAAYLKSVKGSVKNAYIIGGDGVISNNMMKSIASSLGLTVNKTVQRLAGKNRYLTCVAVNEKFADVLTSKTVCVSTGMDFPDALAGGVYAASQKAPLFLINHLLKKPSLLEEQTAYLKNKKANRITIFGGTGVVQPAYEDIIKKLR